VPFGFRSTTAETATRSSTACATVEGRDAAATLAPGETLTVDLGDVAAFRERCPDQFGALVDWTAHINADSIYYGEARRVALAFSG